MGRGFKHVKEPVEARECDLLCPYRPCYHPGEDKGTFVQGRGYTSYFDKPITVCVTRMNHGCPPQRKSIADIDAFIRDCESELNGLSISVVGRRTIRHLLEGIKLDRKNRSEDQPVKGSGETSS